MPKMFLHSTKHHIEGCVYKAKIKKHKKIGNNQKCPCGSKKKYKKCCKNKVILNKADKIHTWQTKKGIQSCCWNQPNKKTTPQFFFYLILFIPHRCFRHKTPIFLPPGRYKAQDRISALLRITFFLQHFLYFFPLSQGHFWLFPIFLIFMPRTSRTELVVERITFILLVFCALTCLY